MIHRKNRPGAAGEAANRGNDRSRYDAKPTTPCAIVQLEIGDRRRVERKPDDVDLAVEACWAAIDRGDIERARQFAALAAHNVAEDQQRSIGTPSCNPEELVAVPR